jgi:DNA-binding Lrp family transcriptional regulator
MPVFCSGWRKLLLCERRPALTEENGLIKALLCVNTESCSEAVAENLRRLDGVKEAYASVGSYDVVAMLEAEDILMLRDLTIPKIRKVDKVKSTLTLMVAEETP